jgi:hypothetical protein
MVCVIFDHVILYVASFRTALGTRLNIDVRHTTLSAGIFAGGRIHKAQIFASGEVTQPGKSSCRLYSLEGCRSAA